MTWYLVKHRDFTFHFAFTFSNALYDVPLLTKWIKVGYSG